LRAAERLVRGWPLRPLRPRCASERPRGLQRRRQHSR